MSVAAFGRVLRTLGGKNIGKCRLRAHQHPLLPPLSYRCRARSIQNLQSKTRRQRAMERVLGNVMGCGLKMGCFLHRFLISGPNLGIDARISPFTPSCVQRFLISGPDLRITARFSPETHSNVQRFRISWGQFGNRCKELPGNVLLRAAILDFGPRFENHCKIFPRNTLQRASILDFRLRLGNRCTIFPV